MCGRFVSTTPPDELATYFGAHLSTEAALPPEHNVAPTDDVYAVVHHGSDRRLTAVRWGLVPSWATSPSIGSRMINARADGLATKNAFKQAFRQRRCIVPADGFYEWRTVPGHKARQPYFVHRRDGEPLAFAGLWEQWRDRRDRAASVLRSATIVTTEANETMAPIHDRMPVILAPAAWTAWLDPDDHDLTSLQDLLVPAPPELLVLHPVSTAVGNVRNHGPELTAPIPDDQVIGVGADAT